MLPILLQSEINSQIGIHLFVGKQEMQIPGKAYNLRIVKKTGSVLVEVIYDRPLPMQGAKLLIRDYLERLYDVADFRHDEPRNRFWAYSPRVSTPEVWLGVRLKTS